MNDQARDIALALELDDAVRAASFAHQVSDQLTSANRTSPQHTQLALAFQFNSPRAGAGDGVYFKPVFVFDDACAEETELHKVDDETIDLWTRVASLVKEAEAQARLHDLLFERRSGDVGNHASKAIDAYLLHGCASEPPEFNAVRALSRALALCELTASDRTAEVKDAMLQTAERCLDDSDEKPGILCGLLEPVVADRTLPGADSTLRRARDRYAQKIHAVESVIDLQRRRASTDDERRLLDEDLIRLLLAHADGCDALVASHFRERAATLARDRGLPLLAEEAVAAMQRSPKPELARFGTEINLDETQIELHIESMIGEDWWESVQLLLSQGPPSGNLDSNLQSAEGMAKASALLTLTPTTILGADGLPRYTASTDEQKADHRLTQVEQHAMQILGRIHVSALFRVVERFEPSVDDIAERFRSVGRDEETSSAIAQVIQRLRTDDYTGVVFVSLPLIEKTVRDLLLTIDEPLYRVQRKRSPGVYPGLGVLLPALAVRGLDPSWHRYLRTLLASPDGFNLRNEALHGFVVQGDALWAGLVVTALLFVATLQTRPTEQAETTEDD